MKTVYTIAAILVIALLALVGFNMFFGQDPSEPQADPGPVTAPQGSGVIGGVQQAGEEDDDDTTVTTPEQRPNFTIIGKSVQGRDIIAYHYGSGPDEILFVAAMHGGYAWNTALMAYQLMAHLEANPSLIPENVTVTVIPVLNPDGLVLITGKEGRFSETDITKSVEETIPGRFNANNIDLNRNFDCEWQTQGVWQDKTVSGGSAPFSEPESVALRNYVLSNNIVGAVFWFSAVGGVFSSSCNNGILAETVEMTQLYAQASGYPAYEEFDFYAITGDAVNWLAKNNIPAISVLQTTHSDAEWRRNQAGIESLLRYFSR